MNWFKSKVLPAIPRVLPKIVIAFEQSGCMANILEFKYIGYVTKEYMGEGYNPVDYYEIQPLIKGSTENRNNKIEKQTAWQIQHLGLNIYIHYI